MNEYNLGIALKQYIERYDELHSEDGPDEGYKWRAVRCFTENWDIDAEDFPAMFKAAMRETSNLIDNARVQPIGGLLLLLKEEDEVEFVREAFSDLFSEDGGDIDARQGRAEAFMDVVNKRIDRYARGSWKYPQRMNNVVYYLNLWRPEENYIFKATEAENWANYIEFGDDFGSGASFSLAAYYRMCDELRAAAIENAELMDLRRKRIVEELRGFDDDHHILVYDIIYCAHTYNFYVKGIAAARSSKERQRRAELRQELEQVETQLHIEQEKLPALSSGDIASMDMTGMNVAHKMFGEGKVLSQNNGIQQIEFPQGVKKFLYPNAYTGGFLKASDAVMEAIQTSETRQAERIEIERRIAGLRNEHERIRAELES